MMHPFRFVEFGIGRGGDAAWAPGWTYADDRDGQGLLDVFEGEGGGGVAGDDEEVCALLVEELCAGDGVAGDGLAGLGAVGETGGVAEVDVVGAGDERQQRAEDGEAAEAGVEDADGGGLWSGSCGLILGFCFAVIGYGVAGGFGWWDGFGGGVGGGVGAEEVGVAGEGVVGLAVDQEADGGDLREGGVEGADDGLHGEGFDLDAGGVVVDEAAAEVDDGQLAGLFAVSLVSGSVRRKTSSTAGPPWSGWARVGESVGGEEVFEQGAGADGWAPGAGRAIRWWG